MMKNLVKSLGAIVVLFVLLFGLRTALTPMIAEKAAAEQQAMLETLLPGSKTFTSETYVGEDTNITGLWHGETGTVVETTVDGYAAPICVWAGVDANGSITGVVVRQMNETFGLGRNALTDTAWLSQFIGTTGSAEVGSDIDAITGATVTSKAIAKAVNSAAAYISGADVSTGATEWGG